MQPDEMRGTWKVVLGMLLSVVVLVFAIVRGAGAATPAPAAGADPGTGTLSALLPGGMQVEMPLAHTDVDVAVSGMMARASVTQTFVNPYTQRIEAVYVFPLPEDAAVDDMTMRIGSRVIRGLLRERAEATRMYDEARRAGKTASLLTQERPNIFTQAVANILPGDAIEVTISYVQYLKYDKGTLSLAFPMVVGPRYIPGASYAPDGSVTPVPGVPQSVPDAGRITPPVLRPGERSGHDIAVTVKLSAGVPFRDLRSKSHEVVATRVDDSNAIVRLSPADSIPNKDFVLEWDVDPERVATGLLAHSAEPDHGFFTLMMVPAASPSPADVTGKEMVFVIDASGSMSGNPIEQAKQLVRHALANLNPKDSFQILNFSMSARGLAPLPLPNTPANVKRALAYLETLQGEGGTEMLSGIRAALDFPPDPDRLRIVMFLTDGYIGNETEILAAIRERIGDARLFAFGVGSSVNRYLLENMAIEGRGTVQYVRYDEDATAPVARFYDQIRSPLLTHVEIDWGGLDVREVLPARLPDLFAGHPLLVTGRYSRPGTATVRVKGRIGGEEVVLPVEVSLPAAEPRNSVLRSLWARRAIEEVMREMLRGEQEALVRQVIELSTHFRVLSQYTAFVAIEEKVRTNERGEPVRVEVPVELPDGVSFEGVFGGDGEREEAAGGLAAPKRARAVTASGSGKGGGGRGGGVARPAAAPSGGYRVSSPAISAGVARALGQAAPAMEDASPDRADYKDVEARLSVTLSVESASGIEAGAADKAVATVLPSVRRCLAFLKAAGVDVPGSLVVVLKAGPGGKVTSALLTGAPAGLDASLVACIERTFRLVRLTGPGEVRVKVTAAIHGQ